MEIMELAERLEACAEDAKRPTPAPGYGPGIAIAPMPQIISLANGLLAIAAALRSRAMKENGDE